MWPQGEQGSDGMVGFPGVRGPQVWQNLLLGVKVLHQYFSVIQLCLPHREIQGLQGPGVLKGTQ